MGESVSQIAGKLFHLFGVNCLVRSVGEKSYSVRSFAWQNKLFGSFGVNRSVRSVEEENYSIRPLAEENYSVRFLSILVFQFI